MYRIKILFYEPVTWYGHVLCTLFCTRYSHVTVSVSELVYNSSWGVRTGWYEKDHILRAPDSTLFVDAHLDVDLVDKVLPKNHKYPHVTTITNLLLGRPRYPLSCVGATRRLLLLAGVCVSGRTPYGLYKQLKQRPEVSESPV